MRVNIFQNNVCSIDFDTVDQVIDFIKKFNSQETPNTITGPSINPLRRPFETGPEDPWYNWHYEIKVGDTIPDPHVVNCTGKNANYTTTITYDTTIE